MPTTRSADRNDQNGIDEGGAGIKRKPGATTPEPTRSTKQQKTLEETAVDRVPQDRKSRSNGEGNHGGHHDDQPSRHEKPKEKNVKTDAKIGSAELDQSEVTRPEHSAQAKGEARDEKLPPSLLEKGLIYFFFRGRVGVSEPHGVQDIARSYIVLRPLPLPIKIGEGSIEDQGKNRLLALPKKVLPKSHRDRFMLAFVEKTNTTLQELKDNFIAASDYSTQTAGTRHTPAATPAGEGVYAITTTGRESHIAYIMTRPEQVGEIQEQMGLRPRGSFVVSAKNPKVGGPANTNLPKSAEFPPDLLEEFRGRAWMPLQPRMLEFANTQFLLIGEGLGEIKKAGQGTEEDQRAENPSPLDEMEKLEHEDDLRVQHLPSDDPVFEDLHLNSQGFKGLQTTW